MVERKFFLVSDGTKIYYEVTGNGFPLVMLHGNGNSGRVFKKQVAFLKKYYRCIVIDSRGHGKSENLANTLNFSRMSKDLQEILEHEGINKIHLLGFSDGGNIAARFVVDYPTYVEKLILNAANLQVNGLHFRARFLSRLEIFFAKLVRRNVAIKNLLLQETRITKSELNQITQPTLILVGQFDVVYQYYSENLAKQISTAVLKVVPSAKHNFLWKLPRNYNKIVLDFLQKNFERS